MRTKNEDSMPEEEGSKKPKRQRYGGPPPKGLEARKASGNVCTARRTNGQPCSNFAITGANVCRTHGGAAPQVRAKAQVRILMASDLAASKLIEMMSSPKVADNIKLAAARDLLDRANLGGTQNIEVGVTKRTFEDWVGDALTDVAEDDDDDPNVWDADVIVDDDEPLVPRDPEVQNRYDRAVFAEVERGQPLPTPKRALSQVERFRMEAEERAMLGGVAPTDDANDRPAHRMSREELLLAKDAGYNFSSRGQARRAAVEDDERHGRRRTRIRDGGMGGR